MALALAVCSAHSARRPDDRSPHLKSLDSLFYAGRYDTLQVILPALIRDAEARGDSAALGRLVFHRGRVEITLGHQAVASGLLDRSIRLTEAARDTVGLLPALHFKAFVLRDSGNPDAAMALFERERDLAFLSRVPVAEGSAISSLAYRDLRRGNLDDAKRGYAKALALTRRSGSAYGLVGAELSMGLLHRALGDIDSSLYWYRDALRLARHHRFPMHELWALNNLGLMEMDTGNWESAASYYEGALAIGRRIGFDRGQALPLMNLSLVWSYLGEIDRAQRAIDECLEVSRRAGFKDLEVGNTTALAVLNLESGRSRQAAVLFRRNVNREFVFNQLQRSEAAYGLALALAQMDSVTQALEVLEPYVAPRVETPDFTIQAYFEIAYAELLYRDGRFDQALSRAVAVRDDVDRHGRTDLGVAARLLESSCRRVLGDPALAAGTLSLALDSLEVARTDFGDDEWREAYGTHVMGDVIEGCRVMLQYPPEAPRAEREQRFYDTLQRFKTRTLLERIRDPREGGAPISGAMTNAITLERLQRDILQPGELLLDLFVSRDATYLFAVSPDSCRMVSLPGWRSRLTDKMALYSDLLSATDRPTRESYPPERMAEIQRTLGQAMLEPVADLLAPSQRVVLAADGFFASIPWGTLRVEDDAMLMESKDVVEVPSASVLGWVRERSARSSRVTALVALEGGDERELSGARREIRALQRRYDGVEVVTAGAGVLDTLARHAQPGRILHVAAHARVNDESPWQSGFMLAADTSDAMERMVTLRAWEIARARLPYEMSVLAGCETAGGRATSGEGVLGLTSAFLSAGVPVVVSTRWPVDDEATAVLMEQFYDRLAAGETVAAALRGAQLAVRANRKTSHPFYWAGFAVVGDGTRVITPIVSDRRRTLWLTALAGAMVAAGIAGWSWHRRRPAARGPEALVQ